jgi:3-deoxy-manno-octulosonate cytidylyltransferase (CMP-KDO synthetase)
LADIHGKPMVWWVYQQASKVASFEDVYVATDSYEIKNVCEMYAMNVIMTRDNHCGVISRIHELSEKIDSDVYVVVNGDEPLIEPATISAIIPKSTEGFYASNLMTAIKDPVEAIDITNIKVVFSSDMNDNPNPPAKLGRME